MTTKEFDIFLEFNSIPEDIIEFNRELNSYDYGILINGKKEVEENIDFRKYRTIPIDIFKKYKCGVCWDFVNYESYWFKSKGYEFKTYFIMIDDNMNCPTHTFLVFRMNGKSYYFESSWFHYQGIREFDTDKDAVKFVLKNHVDMYASKYPEYSKYPYYTFEYNTLGMDKNLTANQFIDKILKNGKKVKL